MFHSAAPITANTTLNAPFYDLAFGGLLLLNIVLVLVVIFGERKAGASWGGTLAWGLLTLAGPLVGFAAWLVWTASVRPELRAVRRTPVLGREDTHSTLHA